MRCILKCKIKCRLLCYIKWKSNCKTVVAFTSKMLYFCHEMDVAFNKING
jgi:hypothetical protein